MAGFNSVTRPRVVLKHLRTPARGYIYIFYNTLNVRGPLTAIYLYLM